MVRDKLINDLFDTMDIAKRSMQSRMQSVIGDQRISRTQLELLFTIHHLQPISHKDLAAQLHLSPGAVSQLMDSLDQQELVERQVDPSDRRRQTLRVSLTGAAMLKDIEKRRRTMMEHVMEGLSNEDLAAWLRIQRTLISAFKVSHEERKEVS